MNTRSKKQYSASTLVAKQSKQSPSKKGRPDSLNTDPDSDEKSLDQDTDTDVAGDDAPQGNDFEGLNGLTEDGTAFSVPPTRDTLHMLMRLNELPTIITWICMLITLYLGLPDEYCGVPVLTRFRAKAFPPHYLLYVSVFWRLMYNVFLGYILDRQSRTKFITKFVQRTKDRKGSLMYKLLSIA
jgi:hypothetical protein